MTQGYKPQPILTEEFRLSFMALYEAQPDMNGIVRFQMEMLFPKERGATAQLGGLQAGYNEALAHAKFGAGGPTPRSFKDAIIDGNSKKQEGRHGMFMIKATANTEINGKPNRPRLLMPDRTIAKPGEIYEGCWCRAILAPYTYEARKDNKANGPIISRGAAFNILTVQKVRDDKPFASFITEAQQDELLMAKPIVGDAGELDELLS